MGILVRFARFVHANGVSFGVVEGEANATQSGLTIAEINSLPFEEVRFTGQRWALADVRLLAPIFSSKVVGIGRNYADHAAELGNDVPKEPMMFIKPSTSVIGPNDAIRLPPQSQQVEHEAELAVVIGATGARRVDRAGAERAIFGYTCGNDVTARDLQRSDGQWTRAKGFDSFCPIGPWIVTADEIPDPHRLAMELRVNGEVRQTGNTDQLLIPMSHLVAYHSPQGYSAGDIITTGTISGVAAVQPNPFDFYLRPGDVVEAEIEGVGTLRNPVVPWKAAHDTPPYTSSLYTEV
jgi:2-keto-4-pentenoate hydratase/2-oxohepta-3-ene-1,7-dioic acid hydratase in catechol pathway